MTATTATPEAVLIGFALIFERSIGLYCSGIACIISTFVRFLYS